MLKNTVLVFAIAFSLVGCGNNNEQSTAQSENPIQKKPENGMFSVRASGNHVRTIQEIEADKAKESNHEK